jgi:hypothetical protein
VSDPRSLFQWDDRAGRYREARTGRFVPRRDVQAALDVAQRAVGARVATLTVGLRTGAVGLAEWELGMRAAIKDVHLYAGAVSAGGWDRLGAAEYGRIGAAVREQYGFLSRWAADLASGAAPLDGRADSRAQLYVEHGRTYQREAELAEARVRGATEYRSVLGDAEHCAECVRESRKGDDGWVPMGSLVPIGQRTCRARCKCWYEYR